MNHSYSFASTFALLLTLFSFFAVGIFAGGIDTSFNANVQATTYLSKRVDRLISLSNGKILAAGYFNNYNGRPVGGLIRLNTDGTLDESFDYSKFKPQIRIESAVELANGKLLLAGEISFVDGQTFLNKIIRLNQDGTLDNTFHFEPSGQIKIIKVDSHGRILVSGGYLATPSFGPSQFIRLNSDGSLDTSFAFDRSNSVDLFDLQGDKIIAIDFEYVPQQYRIRRLNEDGTLDNSFIPKLIGAFNLMDLIAQPDKKLLIYNSHGIFRLNEDGTQDANFNTLANYPSDAIRLFLNADGRITVLFKNQTTGGIRAVRYLANGQQDASFASNVFYTNTISSEAAAVQNDGGIVYGDSDINSSVNRFIRLLPNGSVDSGFNTGTGFQNLALGKVRAINVLSNNKIIIAGDFDKINNISRSKIARLNNDGSLDTTFQINTNLSDNYFSQIRDIYHVGVAPDGKLILSGNFEYSVSGEKKYNLVRINANGDIDTTFNLSLYLTDYYLSSFLGMNKPAALNDGKLLIGTTHNLNSDTFPTPMLMNSNGSKNVAFSPPIFSNRTTVAIFDIAVQSDGKILISGEHAFASASAPLDLKGFLLRLNADGSIDPTFNRLELPDKNIYAFSVLADGRILAAWQSVSQTQGMGLDSSVIGLERNGNVDPTFTSGTGANGKINTIAVLPNGSILVGGLFTTYNGQPRKNLALFKADGTLGPDYGSTNGEVLKISVDSQGRVLVGGQFTAISAGAQQVAAAKGQAARGEQTNSAVSQVEDVSIPYLARFKADDAASRPARFDFDGDGMSDVAVWRETGGIWFVTNSSNNSAPAFQFGQPGDRIVPGDYDGDGKTDYAVWRPSNGIWYLQQSEAGFTAIQWGLPTDLPVQGDFDGDGRTDVAVWRPSTGIWFEIDSSTGQIKTTQYGQDGDRPVAGDYDGDGKTDLAVYRPSSGIWFIRHSSGGETAVQFGTASDKVVPADYDGDGKTDLAVYRDGILGMWYLQRSTAGYGERQFGSTGDIPATGDFDGDGNADISVWRPSNGVWYMQRSTSGYTVKQFGQAGDKPIPAANVPVQ